MTRIARIEFINIMIKYRLYDYCNRRQKAGLVAREKLKRLVLKSASVARSWWSTSTWPCSCARAASRPAYRFRVWVGHSLPRVARANVLCALDTLWPSRTGHSTPTWRRAPVRRSERAQKAGPIAGFGPLTHRHFKKQKWYINLGWDIHCTKYNNIWVFM